MLTEVFVEGVFRRIESSRDLRHPWATVWFSPFRWQSSWGSVTGLPVELGGFFSLEVLLREQEQNSLIYRAPDPQR